MSSIQLKKIAVILKIHRNRKVHRAQLRITIAATVMSLLREETARSPVKLQNTKYICLLGILLFLVFHMRLSDNLFFLNTIINSLMSMFVNKSMLHRQPTSYLRELRARWITLAYFGSYKFVQDQRHNISNTQKRPSTVRPMCGQHPQRVSRDDCGI